jgi:hypothetical protein
MDARYRAAQMRPKTDSSQVTHMKRDQKMGDSASSPFLCRGNTTCSTTVWLQIGCRPRSVAP